MRNLMQFLRSQLQQQDNFNEWVEHPLAFSHILDLIMEVRLQK